MSTYLPIKPIHRGVFNTYATSSRLARARRRCVTPSSVDAVNLLEPDTPPSILKLQPGYSSGASRAYIRICRSSSLLHELADQFIALSRQIKCWNTSGIEVVLSDDCGMAPSGHAAIQKLLDTRNSQVGSSCWEAGEVRRVGARLCKGGNVEDFCDGAYRSWGATRAGVVLDAAAEGDEFEGETSARGRELGAAAGGGEAWSVSNHLYGARTYWRGSAELRGSEKSNGSVREEGGD